jgi:hypothetical protein
MENEGEMEAKPVLPIDEYLRFVLKGGGGYGFQTKAQDLHCSV